MTYAPGEPPLDALPPNAAATVEDVRASRRWTVVALVWAIAASAIAVIALVQANNDNNNDNNRPTQTTQGVTPQQLDGFKSQTNDRLDAFSRRLNDTAAQSDVQKLDKRLTQAENDVGTAKSAATKQSDTITQMQSDIKDLQRRVSNLENKQNSSNNQSSTP